VHRDKREAHPAFFGSPIPWRHGMQKAGHARIHARQPLHFECTSALHKIKQHKQEEWGANSGGTRQARLRAQHTAACMGSVGRLRPPWAAARAPAQGRGGCMHMCAPILRPLHVQLSGGVGRPSRGAELTQRSAATSTIGGWLQPVAATRMVCAAPPLPALRTHGCSS